MNYHLSEILDVEQISELLRSYTEATGLVSALLDLDGNILSQSGWQPICTDFHRVHPKTAMNCKTSDTTLANKLVEGGEFNVYKCLNGLVDVAVPLKVNGHHIGNLFTGQFLMEQPDVSFFKKQAEKYNFDKHKYLESLKEVPILKIEEIKSKLNFLLQMTRFITELGLAKINQIEANKALKNSELKFKRLAENSPAVVYQFKKDIDGNYGFPYVSESVKNALNIHARDIISDGNILMNLIHPDDKDENTRKIEESANKLVKFSNVMRFVLASGKTIWVESLSTPEKQKDGSIIWDGFFQDITDRKHAELSLGISEKKYKSLFENLNEGFALHEIITDDKGKPIDYRYLEINPAFKQLTGIKEDVIGKTIREVFPNIENDPANWIDKYGEIALSGNDISFEDYSDELHKWFNIHAFSPQKGQFAVTFTDITDRKRAEEELRNQLNELQRWHQVTLGREGQILKLKKEVNDLLYQRGEALRFGSILPENMSDETKV